MPRKKLTFFHHLFNHIKNTKIPNYSSSFFLFPFFASLLMPHSSSMMSEALSPIMVEGAWVLEPTRVGITEASATRRLKGKNNDF